MMTKENMKRKIAAVLCMAMISGLAAPSVLAEELDAEAAAVETAPQYTKIQITAEVVDDAIIVRASGMSNPVICATLDGVLTQNMNGTKYTFEDVANGEHTVQVRYNAPDAAAFASDVLTVTVNYAPVAAEPVKEPVAKPVAEPVKEPVAEPVVEPVIEPVQEPVVEPVYVEPVVVEPVQDPETIEPSQDPVIMEQPVIQEPVIDLSADPIAPVDSVDPISPIAPSDAGEAGDNQEPDTASGKIGAEVTTGADAITVRITAGLDAAMYVAVGADVRENLYKGDAATFDGLAPGSYDIEVDYVTATGNGGAFRTSATVGQPSSGDTTGGSDTNDGDTTGGSVTPIVPSTPDEGDTTGGSDTNDGDTTGGSVTPIVPSTPDEGDTTGGSDTNDGGTTGGSVTPIVPSTPDEGGTTGGAEEVKSFKIVPVVTDGVINVVVDGASSREVDVALLDADGKELVSAAVIGNGGNSLVNLGRFSSGTYTVRAQYVTPVQGPDGSYDFKTVTATVTVPDGVTVDPGETQAIDIKAKVETGKDYVIVTVTESADTQMYVALGDVEPKIINKGGSVRFDGLIPGKTYDIEVDYVNPISGTSPYRGTVSIPAEPALDALKITGVTAGTNMLTVSGTATAGQQVVLTTTPAAASDVYAVAGSDGKFSAQIACAAGTYTAVTAKYVADSSKTATATGSWVVAAPAAKPTLTVDAIDTTSTTVIAKTTPGIVVEIKTSDYSQKVVADENGILRFSLPHTYAEKTKFTFTVYYGDNLSFTQEAAVAKVPYLGTLEYGDEGSAVKKLTARLQALGYPVKETSRYGSTVREAVRLFQIANGLDADGIAGKKTQQVLFSVSAIPYGTDRYPTLVRGDRGLSLIYTLQQRLKDLGYYTIKVDGIFGSGTQRAVRLFQQVNGLSVTGKADHTTQALLYSSSAKPIYGSVSGDYTTLSRSSRYKSAVVPMQRRLKSLGYYTGNIDGYFGSQTYRAVRNFQSRNGLSVTGVADPYTQQVLYSSSARRASGSSSSGSSSSGYRLLYWGCRGDSVKRLQSALIDAGYKSVVRKADGIFGQWTYDAVKAYQKDHGLAVDGIAGKNTQNSLYGTHY